jgi:hypothetical protein
MSLQTDLHNAVAQVVSDSTLLHNVIHGTSTQTVSTLGGAVSSVAKLIHDADVRINVSAEGILVQSQAQAQQALMSAELASEEADRAQQVAAQGVTSTTFVLEQVQVSGNQILTDAESVLQQVVSRLQAVGIPDVLSGAHGMLLKVKADESGYELVNTAALPRFYGFSLSSDGSELLLTQGREDVFDATSYASWMVGEGLTFSIQRNGLEMSL